MESKAKYGHDHTESCDEERPVCRIEPGAPRAEL